MKHRNIFWGTLLITMGLLLLLDRLGVFSFSWWTFGKLWPFLLILWGVSILPVKGIIKIILALVVAALSVLMYMQHAPLQGDSGKNFHYNYDDDNDEGEWADSSFSQVYTELYTENIQKANLTMDAGAGVFILKGTTGELVYAENKGGNSHFDFKVEQMDDLAKISIEQRSDINVGKNKGSRFNLMLNPNPVWSFDFSIGAAEFDFDFSEFKLEKLDVDGGAASIKVKIGELYPETHVNINAGASAIKVIVPENAGCMIEGSSVLSSRNLEGFDKIGKGHYQTPNFEEATQKIYISMDAAVSSFTVLRK